MEHFASNIKIQNFKSIQELELNDCNRINLLIGKPNVGKSNILEAMSLQSIPHIMSDYRSDYDLKELIRFERKSELFFDGEIESQISIQLLNNRGSIYKSCIWDELDSFAYSKKGLEDELSLSYRYDNDFHLKNDLDNVGKPFLFGDDNNFCSYLFLKNTNFKVSQNKNYLLPPHGENLFKIVQDNKYLKQECIKLLKNYGLHLVFDKSSNEIKVMKGVENGEIFLIPFTSIADSLQRLIFYKAAIMSNNASILTFEEPEAHTYPPYIAQIARDIIDAKTNQFFITTHSPYVVNELLENAQDELAIYMVDFKDGQTVVRRLTDNELDEVYNDGIDLFFNNEFFL